MEIENVPNLLIAYFVPHYTVLTKRLDVKRNRKWLAVYKVVRRGDGQFRSMSNLRSLVIAFIRNTYGTAILYLHYL